MQAIDILRELIAIPSVTPHDEGCQPIICRYLQSLGFEIELLPSGPVHNFWARRGEGGPLFTFAGHTDVVSPGPTESWHTPPFELTEQDGQLYGRGVADMKGGIAAMLAACSQFIEQHPHHQGSIGFIITSGEEGDYFDLGTPVIMQYLEKKPIHVDWCIIGEPSSSQRLGDMIKNGRRGTLSGELMLQGKQGHVAYAHLAENPIHLFAQALVALTQMEWDQGNEYFPATTFQISNIQAGTGETNVIPGELKVKFNFRFCPESTPLTLQLRVENILKQHHLKYQLHWRLNGEAFLTPPGQLIRTSIEAVHAITGQKPVLSTTGGTSDGRFIAPYGIEVIELGLCSQSIHQMNEHIGVQDLKQLTDIYYKVLEALVA